MPATAGAACCSQLCTSGIGVRGGGAAAWLGPSCELGAGVLLQGCAALPPTAAAPQPAPSPPAAVPPGGGESRGSAISPFHSGGALQGGPGEPPRRPCPGNTRPASLGRALKRRKALKRWLEWYAVQEEIRHTAAQKCRPLEDGSTGVGGAGGQNCAAARYQRVLSPRNRAPQLRRFLLHKSTRHPQGTACLRAIYAPVHKIWLELQVASSEVAESCTRPPPLTGVGVAAAPGSLVHWAE